jgi:5-hydroxyisourate hydrolase
MSPITTHVLDTALGCPARRLRVTLARVSQPFDRGEGHLTAVGGATGGAGVPVPTFSVVAEGVTDDDGRVSNLLPAHPVVAGTYRLTFHTGPYLAATQRPVFFPQVDVTFEVERGDAHIHVPLLLSPFGYSTYRGT